MTLNVLIPRTGAQAPSADFFLLREASLADAAPMAALKRACLLANPGICALPSARAVDRAYDAATLEAAIAQAIRMTHFGCNKLMVAERNGLLAGLCLAHRQTQPTLPQHRWVIDSLYVAETARGLGLGRRLLTAMLQGLASHKALPAELMVESQQTAASSLYASLGELARTEHDRHWVWHWFSFKKAPAP